MSWHLGKLRATGIVATRRNGRETLCSLRPEAFSEMAARERALFGRSLTTEMAHPAVAPAIGDGAVR